MIKFFRKIRYELMEKNKTGKYLKYAIGEIILVVIGILIALSINNWNENRKLKTEYISDLKTIKENLKYDARTITTNLMNGSRINKKLKLYLNTDSLIINESSVITKLGAPSLFFDDSGYKTAKGKNTLNLIQNDSLEKLFYEYYVKRIGMSKQYAEMYDQLVKSLQTYYLESGHQNEGISNKEIMNRLMQQRPFINFFDGTISSSERLVELLKTLKEVNEKLTKTIDTELMHIE